MESGHHHIMLSYGGTINTIEFIKNLYKDKISSDLELGLLSCYAGGINKDTLLAEIPEINHLYLSSAGEYVTLLPYMIDNHIEEDALRYDFGQDISPLAFFYRYNSLMTYGYYLYQEDIHKIHKLEKGLIARDQSLVMQLLFSNIKSEQLTYILRNALINNDEFIVKTLSQNVESSHMIKAIRESSGLNEQLVKKYILPYLTEVDLVEYVVLLGKHDEAIERLDSLASEVRI